MTSRQRTDASNQAFEASWMLGLLALCFLLPAAIPASLSVVVVVLLACGAAATAAALGFLIKSALIALGGRR